MKYGKWFIGLMIGLLTLVQIPTQSIDAQAGPTPTPTRSTIRRPAQLLFSDEFNVDGVPDTNKWQLSFWYGDSTGSSTQNSTVQSYHLTRNVSVQGGLLRLKAVHEPYDADRHYEYTSAVITTGRLGTNTGPAKFERFPPFYVEWRAKPASGLGLWSGLWMVRQWDNTVIGTLPEIDAPEVLGNRPYDAYLSVHDNTVNSTTSYNDGVTRWDLGFHTYSTEVLSDGTIIWSIDGVERRRVTADPSTLVPWYFLMDVQVGACGSWADCPENGQGTFFPAESQIDWIHVYDHKP